MVMLRLWLVYSAAAFIAPPPPCRPYVTRRTITPQPIDVRACAVPDGEDEPDPPSRAVPDGDEPDPPSPATPDAAVGHNDKAVSGQEAAAASAGS